MDISKKILKDPVNRWFFSRKIKESYLVGGYVRDILRGTVSRDKDFTLADLAESVAKEAAKKIKGRFIELCPGQTFRVVSKDKQVLDFSSLNLPVIKDLQTRDFTVNAIAWNPDKGIIDPCKGREDIKKGLIRAVRMKNLGDDPLRTLRAYRIAAELGFKIDPKTRKHLAIHSRKLSSVARERTTEELYNLLCIPEPSAVNYFDQCLKDKVLDHLIISCNAKKSKVLAKNITILKHLDHYLLKEKNKAIVHTGPGSIARYLNTQFSQGLSILGLMRLSCLLNGLTFNDIRIKPSTAIHRAVRDIHNSRDEINRLLKLEPKKFKKNFYKILDASGDRVYETAMLTAYIKKESPKKYFMQAKEFLKKKNKNLLNGNDVQKMLGLRPGRQVGNILDNLKELQLADTIKTRAEAKKWLKRNYT